MPSQVRILFSPPLLKYKIEFKSGSSSVGRALAFQAKCREFEPRLPLFFIFQVSLIKAVVAQG